MFSWYKSASTCYVCLEDVRISKIDKIWLDKDRDARWKDTILQVKRARWLKRGWTLQEFIASKTVIFYDYDWNYISALWQFKDELANATGIPKSIMGSNGIEGLQFAKTTL